MQEVYYNVLLIFHQLFQNIFSNSRSAIACKASRLELGYAFSLGLSFLVGGSILKTMTAPTWNDIG